jgi:hypothetical protein
MDGVTAIANILRMEGVDFIGCVPYQPLLEAAAIAGIRPLVFRQEGTGIHMVDGYSRVTNGQRVRTVFELTKDRLHDDLAPGISCIPFWRSHFRRHVHFRRCGLCTRFGIRLVMRLAACGNISHPLLP